MPDYKEMYLHLMRETEKAISLLAEAQRECERRYIESEDEDSGDLRLPGVFFGRVFARGADFFLHGVVQLAALCLSFLFTHGADFRLY